MNITFLIGNGFDINLGLKTHYSNFYKYYRKKESSNSLIEKLKEDIDADYDTWADLEIALGAYTANLKSREEFDTVFEDIQESLAEYIANEEEKFSYDLLDKTPFYNNFIYPEQYLPQADINLIRAFKNKWGDSASWFINIITFNYTKVLDRLFDGEKNINLVNFNSGRVFKLDDIKHVHGCTDGNMILGVNDISQIGNEDFKNNIDILEAIIKPECNKTLKHLIDGECEKVIKTSNLICLFGVSIGDTDKIWWEAIGERLLYDANTMLVLFAKGQSYSVNQGYRASRKARLIKEYFLSQTGLNEAAQKEISNKIIIGYNTNIFDLKLERKEEEIEINELISNI